MKNFKNFKKKFSLIHIIEFLLTRSITLSRTWKEARWAKEDAKSMGLSDQVLFIDLGANLGQAYKWFKRYYRNDNVTFELFEPNPHCCKKLRENPAIASGKVKLFEAAVSTYSGEANLYGIAPNEGGIYSVGGSITEAHKRIVSDNPSKNFTKVNVVDFSEYLEIKHKSYNKIVVKMDIEGAEVSLLENLILTGNINFIDILYVEFHSIFHEPSEASDIEKREQKIIYELKKIPEFQLRIWH